MISLASFGLEKVLVFQERIPPTKQQNWDGMNNLYQILIKKTECLLAWLRHQWEALPIPIFLNQGTDVVDVLEKMEYSGTKVVMKEPSNGKGGKDRRASISVKDSRNAWSVLGTNIGRN